MNALGTPSRVKIFLDFTRRKVMKLKILFLLTCAVNQILCSSDNSRIQVGSPRTFPGAEIIGSILLPVIGSIVSPSVGLPPISHSQTTSIATSVHNKPVAISHSSSISSGSSTSSSGSAVVQKPGVSAQSAAGSRKFFKSFFKRF